MTQVMSPSVSANQIGKILDLLAAKIRKSGWSSEVVQQMIEHSGGLLANELFAVVKKFVDAASKIIVRTVQVNRARTPQEAIAATRRKQYLNNAVVEAMPRGEGDTATVYFVNLDRWVGVADLQPELAKIGYKLADPYALLAANEADPNFAKKYSNATQWQDAEGKFCCATCNDWNVGRRVYVNRHDHAWDVYWWFAVVPQESSALVV